ncbi:hypothetical protein ACLKA7_012079 [Drosophila subpalustris]
MRANFKTAPTKRGYIGESAKLNGNGNFQSEMATAATKRCDSCKCLEPKVTFGPSTHLAGTGPDTNARYRVRSVNSCTSTCKHYNTRRYSELVLMIVCENEESQSVIADDDIPGGHSAVLTLKTIILRGLKTDTRPHCGSFKCSQAKEVTKGENVAEAAEKWHARQREKNKRHVP